MGKMKDALRKLGFKVNGKTPSGDSTAKIIDDIAENYEGGSEGTTVVANPTLVGTEDNLTGLEVNGVKYAVPQGSGGGVDLYNHIIEITGQNGSTCSVQLVTPDSSQYNYYSLAEYIMNRGIDAYDGGGEEAEPYWYIPTSGVLVIPPQTEEGDATYGVASRLIATVVGSGLEEQDYNLRIAGIGFDGNQAGDDYSVVQDVVTPMVQANNNEEEEPPVEEGPATEE